MSEPAARITTGKSVPAPTLPPSPTTASHRASIARAMPFNLLQARTPSPLTCRLVLMRTSSDTPKLSLQAGVVARRCGGRKGCVPAVGTKAPASCWSTASRNSQLAVTAVPSRASFDGPLGAAQIAEWGADGIATRRRTPCCSAWRTDRVYFLPLSLRPFGIAAPDPSLTGGSAKRHPTWVASPERPNNAEYAYHPTARVGVDGRRSVRPSPGGRGALSAWSMTHVMGHVLLLDPTPCACEAPGDSPCETY
jgi:hypothetical protein